MQMPKRNLPKSAGFRVKHNLPIKCGIRKETEFYIEPELKASAKDILTSGNLTEFRKKVW